MITRLALALWALAPTVAHAGARQIPRYDVETPDDALTWAKRFKFTLQGKPKAYPRRVAIGAFHARYVFKQTSVGKQRATYVTLEFSEETYARITSALYDQLVARLEAEGLEVVPLEDVVSADAYGALDGSEDARESQRRAVHAPAGMRRLALRGGAPAKLNELAALNAELGTDAVISAYVNFGVCDMEPTARTEMRAGIYACLRGDVGRTGFDLRFLGAGKGARPGWTARVYKQPSMYTYNKRDKNVYDMALVARYSAALAQSRSGFWGGWDLAADQADFVGGASEVFDDAMAMAFAAWERKHGRARQRAGVVRGPVHDPEATPPTAPATHPLAPLPGTVSCWTGESTHGDVVMRRGVDLDGNRIVEDQITRLPSGPVRSAALWTLEGPSASVEDAAGAWSGRATLDGGDWTSGSWTLTGTLTAGPIPFEGTYRWSGDGLVTQTVLRPEGGPAIEVTSQLARADADACIDPFTTVAPPPGL